MRLLDFSRQSNEECANKKHTQTQRERNMKTTNLSTKRASFANKNRMLHIFMTFGSDFRAI